jgi:hypothetical protein
MFSDLGHWDAMRSTGHCSDALAKYSTELAPLELPAQPANRDIVCSTAQMPELPAQREVTVKGGSSFGVCDPVTGARRALGLNQQYGQAR